MLGQLFGLLLIRLRMNDAAQMDLFFLEGTEAFFGREYQYVPCTGNSGVVVYDPLDFSGRVFCSKNGVLLRPVWALILWFHHRPPMPSCQ